MTNLFSKCDQIRRKLQIWSHLLKKSVMENFIFCAVSETYSGREFLERLGNRKTPCDNEELTPLRIWLAKMLPENQT